MVSAAHLHARFFQSDDLHRAVGPDGIQLRHGGGAGAKLLTVRLEAKEQEARELPAAVHGVSGHL